MRDRIRLQSLTVQAGTKTLIEGVSLDLQPGDFTLVVGPNGAGKSSLLRAILGLLRPSEGQILLGDQLLHSLSARQRAAAISWLPQMTRLVEPLPAAELLVAARYRFDESRRVSRERADEILEELGILSLRDRSVLQLSGGELQRVLLGSLLAQEASHLLLDEPINHLDPPHRFGVYACLQQAWRQGRGILCVTHDISHLPYYLPSDQQERGRVLGMQAGRVVFQRMLSDPLLLEDLESLFSVRLERVRVGRREHFLPVEGRTEA